MGHIKCILIKDFQNQKVGSAVIISEGYQYDFFVEQGFIEGEKKQKSKTKKKVETEKNTDED